jgi:hypothetical protein
VVFCKKGESKITLRYGNLKSLSEEGAMTLVDEIALLKPQTMSWSNLMDIPLSGFHALARCCSQFEDTIHYCYTLNWPTEVFGTCISDYVVKFPSEVERLMNKTIGSEATRAAKENGTSSLLLIPIADTPLNLCGYT